MPVGKKPIHQYPHQQPDPEKYLPSFFLDISVENKICRVEVRPLNRDKGYYTINLDGIFLGHIHKSGMFWTDFLGKTNETYQAIGEGIEAYLRTSVTS
jgi:hypothetical protein